MKRKITMILACTGLAGAIMFSSCKKENEISKRDQSLDSLIGKATVSGIAYLVYDATQKPKLQEKEVASGAKITLSYKSTDLAYVKSSKAITYTKTLTTTTDASGKYSFNVDANLEGITYTIQPNQFYGTWVDPKDTTSYKAYFNALSTSISLKKGESQYLDLKYNSTPQFKIPN